MIFNWEDPASFTLCCIVRIHFNFSDIDNDFGPDGLALTWLVKSIHHGWILNLSRALLLGSRQFKC